MNPYEFEFKGQNSSTKGIFLLKTPDIVRPKMRNNQIIINGCPGCRIEKLGYEAYEKILEFYVKDKDKLLDVQSWLCGDGELIIFNEPDKIYDASLLAEVTYSKAGRFYTGKAPFLVQPYKRSTDNEFTTLESGDIQNYGNINSMPLINITGVGIVEVMVNNLTVCTLNIGEEERTLTLDTEKQECFCNGALANRSMSGVFPCFEPGHNKLAVRGNVSQVTYRKGERWI